MRPSTCPTSFACSESCYLVAVRLPYERGMYGDGQHWLTVVRSKAEGTTVRGPLRRILLCLFCGQQTPARHATAGGPSGVASGGLFGAAPPAPAPAGGAFGAAAAPAAPAAGGSFFGFAAAPDQQSVSRRFNFSAPPPPPEAKTAVAQVEGGGGGLGVVTFVVDKPASIK